MKRATLIFGLSVLGLLSVNGQESLEPSEPKATIKCPQGDEYRCYTTADGTDVYKGSGQTIIIIH
jgi:hypothetical protein